MGDVASGPITRLLNAANGGDDDAAAELLPLIYRELHRIAKARMAALRPGTTLQPTALIHEAYLRLIGGDKPGWNVVVGHAGSGFCETLSYLCDLVLQGFRLFCHNLFLPLSWVLERAQRFLASRF